LKILILAFALILKDQNLFIRKNLIYQIIANQSFQEGKFPELPKLSLVTPVFKKGERENPDNFRPISVNSPVSKILEKAFLARLEKHFEKK
jgi:hypothetical protein